MIAKLRAEWEAGDLVWAEQIADLQASLRKKIAEHDAALLQVRAKDEEIKDFTESLRRLLDIVEPMTAGDFSTLEMAQIEGARILLRSDSRHRTDKRVDPASKCELCGGPEKLYVTDWLCPKCNGMCG